MTSETNGDRFRLAWFRRKVAELGKLLELLPSDRRALVLREREEREETQSAAGEP